MNKFWQRFQKDLQKKFAYLYSGTHFSCQYGILKNEDLLLNRQNFLKKLREISLKNANNAKDADTILTPIKQSFFSIKPRPFPFRFKGTNPVLIQLHAIVKQPKLKNCLRHLLYSDFSSFFPISKFQKIQIIDEKSKFFFRSIQSSFS